MLLVLEAFLGGLQLLLPQPVSLDELPVEAALLLLVDHIVGVVVDVFVLLDLLRVIDDHVRLEVELGSVEGDVLALLHRILEVFLHLVLEVAGDWVMEKKEVKELQFWELFQGEKDFKDIQVYVWKEFDVFKVFYESVHNRIKDKVKLMDEEMQAVLSSQNTVLNEKVYQRHLR